jgi:hypothetical protein
MRTSLLLCFWTEIQQISGGTLVLVPNIHCPALIYHLELWIKSTSADIIKTAFVVTYQQQLGADGVSMMTP